MATFDPYVTESIGGLILIYGATGIGKTVSIMSSTRKFVMLAAEGRSMARQINEVDKVRNERGWGTCKEDECRFERYENFDDALELLVSLKGDTSVGAVFTDSLTHLMGARAFDEVVQESFEARGNVDKELASRNKSTVENYGVISFMMQRLMKAYTDIASYEVPVICTALPDSKMKPIDGQLMEVPQFKGKEFLNLMPGFFDLIGRVEQRVDNEGNIMYPPGVRFRDPQNKFMCKMTGISDNPGGAFTLDIEKILEAR